MANGGISKAANTTRLPFPQLSARAASADTFADFPTSLMSVGQTSDDGTVSIFTRDGVTVHREDDVLITCRGAPILIGKRDDRGRYRIPLVQQQGQWRPRAPSKKARQVLRQANSVYDLPSVEQGIKWMHAVCGYPVKSTWIKAIQAGNFVGWPLLTVSNVRRYYPETVETPKGHLNQTRKNVRSTKPKRAPLEEANTASLRGKKVRDVFTHVYDVRETIFSDQTGQFPTRSLRGNKYIMVMVDIDSSAILVEPIKSRKDEELTRAYRALMDRLRRANITPKKHVLDNEVSAAMKSLIRDEYKMELELVPPGCHRRNAAEVAIRNFKAHFLSVLAGVAEDFPLQLWDRLLPQTEITINLLRQSNATPSVSAYAHLCGPFDYNKMPLAPMGCQVQVHEKSDKRGTWAFHSVDGWYLSTSDEHYRTHRCHIKSTNSERLTDTAQFQHKHITNPSLTHSDKLMHAIADCHRAIKGLGRGANDADMRDLRRLLDMTVATTQQHADVLDRPLSPEQVPRVPVTDAHVPRVATPPSQVPPTPEPSPLRRVTRSMTASDPRLSAPPPAPMSTPAHDSRRPSTRTRLTSTSSSAMARRRRRRALRADPPPVPASAPARNTRARTAVAAKLAAPPAANTRSRAPRHPSAIPQPTPSSRRSGAMRPTKASRAKVRHLANAVMRLEDECLQAMAVMDAESGRMLNYRQLLRLPKYKGPWSTSAANEFGRLANGIGGRIKNPTNTIRFLAKHEVPKDRLKDVTYGSFVCTIRPEKAEPLRTRLVVGGDRINYPGEVATPTAELLLAKILFNSVVSTPGARFMTMDISNFYLMTPLKRPEYVRVKLSDIPPEVIAEYKLKDKATADGCIYLEATKGMYGLPQAGLLANELLEKRLNKAGYRQSKIVPGLWKHDWRPIQFALTVDDYAVKYVGKEHALHLLHTLQKDYKVTTDWSGSRYIGVTLDWDYDNRRVHLSMPGYKAKALKQFGHALQKHQDSPFPCAKIDYGARKQYAKEPSSSPPLDSAGKKLIQRICGKFLYLGRCVDSTLLCPISAIAAQSSAPTEETMRQAQQLLDYIASQEEAVLTYSASDMVLATHSDASYLSEPKARSRAGGHFFLSSDSNNPPNNGAILNIAHIIKHVMSSATEAELAALYIMAREAVYIRIILEELGHKQPPTPVQTDNAMADGVINGKVQPKRTKAMDMRFHWLRDRECQEQFRFYWRPGRLNYADYWTKHHSAKHHKGIRREFLTPYIVVEMLRQEQALRRRNTTVARAA